MSLVLPLNSKARLEALKEARARQMAATVAIAKQNPARPDNGGAVAASRALDAKDIAAGAK